MNADSMSLADALKQRRSVRGFLDKPVPQEVLESVFSLAQHLPPTAISSLGRCG